MLSEKINGKKWQQSMLKKLFSFIEKCPILLGVEAPSIKNGKDGVVIIHKGTGNKYFFEYDTTIDVKDFIHNIKEFLLDKHYPRLVEPITESIQLTPAEIAEKIEKNKNFSEISKIELKEIGYKTYRIDKSIVWKGIFILVLEDIELYGQEKPSFEPAVLRYKLNGTASLFMKKYRSGGFASIEEASKDFFSNAILINEIK